MRHFALALLVALSAGASQPAREAEEVVAKLVTASAIPGGAVVVTRGDRVVWQRAFGVTDLGAKTRAESGTRFRVGSVTKMLTVAALLRLVDRGRVRLDDPVSRYLPDYPHGEITLRQLAAHTSGIRHYVGAEFLNQEHFANATASLRRFAADPLLFAPGEKTFYSTYGYNVLGAVIESVTKKDFPEAMRDLVTGPLRMRATTFDGRGATTTLYDAGKEGPQKAPDTDLSDRMPAGAAVTTSGDLARFLIAMTGERFLSRDSRALLLVPQTTSDGKPSNVSVGWRVGTDSAGRTFLHHGGAVTGGRAFVLFYPRERVGVAIVTNLGFARFAEAEALEVAKPFLPAARD